MKKVIVFGASGHAKVIVDILRSRKELSVAGIVDRVLPQGASFFGLPVLGADEDVGKLVAQGLRSGVVAIGDNFIRSKVVKRILEACPDFEFVTAVHPAATIAETARIGAGTVIMAGAVVNPDTRIGSHCIINTGALVDHDNRIGDFATVAPGAVTGGNVSTGDFSVISLGARAIHGMNIGYGAVVGAGSVVLNDIPDLVVAYGTPAKVVRTRVIQDKYL